MTQHREYASKQMLKSTNIFSIISLSQRYCVGGPVTRNCRAGIPKIHLMTEILFLDFLNFHWAFLCNVSLKCVETVQSNRIKSLSSIHSSVHSLLVGK